MHHKTEIETVTINIRCIDPRSDPVPGNTVSGGLGFVTLYWHHSLLMRLYTWAAVGGAIRFFFKFISIFVDIATPEL